MTPARAAPAEGMNQHGKRDESSGHAALQAARRGDTDVVRAIDRVDRLLRRADGEDVAFRIDGLGATPGTSQ